MTGRAEQFHGPVSLLLSPCILPSQGWCAPLQYLEFPMRNIIYLVGLVVIVLAILRFVTGTI